MGVEDPFSQIQSHIMNHLVCKFCFIFFQRNFGQCNQDVKIKYYETYIHPICEYATVIWSRSNIHQLEIIDRKTARFMFSDIVGHLFQKNYLIYSMNVMNYLICAMNYLVYSKNHFIILHALFLQIVYIYIFFAFK